MARAFTSIVFIASAAIMVPRPRVPRWVGTAVGPTDEELRHRVYEDEGKQAEGYRARAQ